MKTAVLVPSHIYYKDQLKRLDRCLESLCSQTVVPDIFVSISFDNPTYKGEFATLLRKYPTVRFKLSAQQKFQMEHLFTLSLLVGEYDMLLFCDDDDTYLPMRVEAFSNAYDELKEECIKRNKLLGGILEVNNTENPKENPPEYWAYGIQPQLLKEFFHHVEGYEDLMRHKFADMYLRNFLAGKVDNPKLFAVLTPKLQTGFTLYQYTTDNPNSICTRNTKQPLTSKDANEIISSNLTLCLITQRNDDLKEQMKAASIPLKKLKIVVPEMDRIQTLVKILSK